MEYSKSTVRYFWKNAKDKGHLSKNSFQTWLRRVDRNVIMKLCAKEDKAKLAPSEMYNKADSRKHGGWTVQTN